MSPRVSDPEDAIARNRATSSIAINWVMDWAIARAGNYSSAVCLLENAASMLKQSALADDFRTKFLIDSVEHCLCVVEEQKREASVGDQKVLDDDCEIKLEYPTPLDQNAQAPVGDQGGLDDGSESEPECPTVENTAVGRGVKIVAAIFVVMIAIVIVAVFIYPSFNL